MRGLAAALLTAGLFVVAGPIAIGPASSVAAHAQLVSSQPGTGERLHEPPTHIELVFTERVDMVGSGVNVVDSDGSVIVREGGELDPADPRRVLVSLPPIADGLYSVTWRALSADDGHSSSGFFTFGVGNVVVPGTGQQTGGGTHSGHGLFQSVLETIARSLAELGSMLALGLAIAFATVARPSGSPTALRMRTWPGVALLASGLGASLMIPVVASSAGIDSISYVTSTATGPMLVGRALLGFIAGGVVLVLVLRDGRWAIPIAGAAGAAAIVLLAASGHAASFGSPTPILFVAAHVGSAGVWLAGLLVLAWMIVGDRGAVRDQVPALVPRFSALALVSVGLFVLSGAYLSWLMNGAIVDLSTDYGRLLVAKSVLGATAIALGALSYLGFRLMGRAGTQKRIPIEAALALGVIGVTALLASSSPPALTRPVPISQASSSAAGHLDASLAMLPARPGPNRLFVELATPAGHDQTLELVLSRIDQPTETRIGLDHSTMQADGVSYATDALLPANSSWDASVRLGSGSTEVGRARFLFAFDEGGLIAGEARPVIDPLILISIVLAAAALLGATLTIAGGVLPRTDPHVSRRAVLIGTIAAAVLAIAGIAGPPPI